MNKEKYLIIPIIILTIIVCAVIATTIFTKKSESVSTNNKENILENEVEYIDTNELEETNEIVENIIENVVEENTIENKQNTQINTNNKVQGTSTYYIKVNYGAQVVTIYTKDADGNYTIPVKAMVCSTGVYTPKSGVYKITSYKRDWNGLMGNVYGKYVTQIVGDILFHSVPYLRKGDSGSLEYWEYDKLGTKASLGCIRLTVQDAMWIYNNCKSGTQVEFYSSSDPGPLGKPTAKKISNAEGDLKNWDPTDPDPNNPWKNYKQEDENNNTESNNNTQTDENTNTTNNVIEENEIVNEVNTNTINSNEISKNETTNEIYTNNIKANEVQTNDKVNNEVVFNEKNLNTNITL